MSQAEGLAFNLSLSSHRSSPCRCLDLAACVRGGGSDPYVLVGLEL